MKKSDVQVGDKVDFLRMNNKSVKLSGEVVKIHEGTTPCVDVKVDGTGGIETAHIDDLTFGDNKQRKERLSLGDRVKFLRMNNKSVELTGTIVVIHSGSVPCVDVEVDGTDGRAETAHIDDVTVLEESKQKKKAAKAGKTEKE